MKRTTFSNIDAVLPVSQWAAKNIVERAWPDVPRSIVYVPHGLTPEHYRVKGVGAEVQSAVPKQRLLCVYSSSWDRGLVQLIEMWPTILKAVPQAQLVVTYGGPAIPGLKERMQQLGVQFAAFSETEMAKLYSGASFWLHPCTGVEMFCIASQKAQCAGTIPVVVPCWALEQTVRVGVQTQLDRFAAELIALMLDEPRQQALRSQAFSYDCVSWSLATDLLETAWLAPKEKTLPRPQDGPHPYTVLGGRMPEAGEM